MMSSYQSNQELFDILLYEQAIHNEVIKLSKMANENSLGDKSVILVNFKDKNMWHFRDRLCSVYKITKSRQ